MLEVLCIVGSPRKSGSTARLVDAVVDGLADAEARVTRRFVSDLDIHFCKGCRECEMTRRCVQRDDMDTICADIARSDVVILASPSYWGDVTAQMKVLIDRSLPMCSAGTGMTPVSGGKIGVAIAVRAGHSPDESQHIIDTFRHYFGHLGVELVGSITGEGISDMPDLSEKAELLERGVDLGKHVAARLGALSLA